MSILLLTLSPRALSPSELLQDQDRTGEVIGASVPLLILPTLAVGLRLLSRWTSRAGFWWDDLTIVLACFLCWGPNIVNLISLHYGFARHLRAFEEQGLFRWFKFLYAFEFLYALAMASVKYSIILFQYRIFPIIQFRRMLLWFNNFVVCFTISCILVSIFQCIPIHDFWDTLAGRLGGRCINVELYFLITGAINAATDFTLLALPIPILWRLRTSQPQKLVLTAIFTVGLTVCAVSITRLIVLHKYGKMQDITWYYVPIAIWTAAEPSIAVVSACLPSLRPLFVRVVWGGTYRPRPSPSRYASSSRRNTPYGDAASFNRLQEPDQADGQGAQWSKHNVRVYGGRRKGDAESDEVELGGREEGGMETPRNRIRKKTEVVLTISERVDWRDDLF